MHNLHLVHLRAETFEDAISEVSGFVCDWHSGTDGVVCGAISILGETYSTGKGKYNPKDYTLLTLKQLVQAWVTPSHKYEQAFRDVAIAFLNNSEFDKSMPWFYAQAFCEYQYELAGIKPEDFDPWKHTFRDSEYDSEGVTNLEQEDCEDLPEFLVFVDMYS